MFRMAIRVIGYSPDCTLLNEFPAILRGGIKLSGNLLVCYLVWLGRSPDGEGLGASPMASSKGWLDDLQ